MRQNWCTVPDPACTCTHLGSGPAPPISAYTMVAPLMARQFSQIQRLGGEHQGAPPTVPPMVLATPISTPLEIDAWAAALQSHPMQEWVECLITGMKEGFRIGLGREPNCQSSHGNTPSATERADVISNFLSSQCRAGHVLGPLPPENCAGVITSCMAVIPPKNSRQMEGHCGPVIPAQLQHKWQPTPSPLTCLLCFHG